MLCWTKEMFAGVAHVLAISEFKELGDLCTCVLGVFPEVVGICGVYVCDVEPFVYVCEVFGNVFLLDEFFGLKVVLEVADGVFEWVVSLFGDGSMEPERGTVAVVVGFGLFKAGV
ncbi:hypothetical protein KC19_VG149800 [Ceratodon purpureus]|uniref:Uncharacterized protein n=1 Tax=Ceratodon purpureus TaxID=3225 RepID=A0A8T0HQ72_CERPU|nr:hypothetical protein KC19_VG149800 [Ceratodon purpureus]